MKEPNYKFLLGKNFSWLTINEVVAKFLGFFFITIMARKLGIVGIGVFSYLNTLLAVLFLFSEFGISTYLLRHWVTHTKDHVDEIRTANVTKIFLQIGIAAVLLVYTVLSKHYVYELWCLFMYYALEGFRVNYTSYYSSQNDYRAVSMLSIVERTLSSLTGIILLLAGAQLLPVLIAQTLAKLCLVLFLVHKFHCFVTFKIDIAKSWALLRASLPLGALTVFGTLYYRVDIIMLKFLRNIYEVGLYSSSYRIMEIFNILPGLFFTAFFPIIVKVNQKNKMLLNNYYTVLYKYLFAAGLFASIGIFTFSKEILFFLFGSSFVVASTTLQVLAFNVLLVFLSMPLLFLLNAKYQERYILKTLSSLTVLNIVLNFFAIHYWGGTGAAISTLVCEIANFYILFQKAHIAPFKERTLFLTIILVNAASFMMFRLLYGTMPWLLLGSLGSAMYFLVLFGLKIINFSELIYWKNNKKKIYSI